MTVVTGQVTYGIEAARVPARVDSFPGARLIRLAAPNPNVGGASRRLLSYSVFLALACLAIRRLSVEVWLAEQPTPAAGAAAIIASKKAAVVLHVSDLWPDVAVSFGYQSDSLLARAGRFGMSWLYARATVLVAATEGVRTGIRRVQPECPTVKVIHNGADDVLFQVERPFGRPVAPVVGYIGTAAAQHGAEVIADVAANLREIKFLVRGSGAGLAVMRRRAASASLSNMAILPAVPRDQLAGVWRDVDVALVTLRPEVEFQVVLPVKLIDAMAAGRPIVAAVSGLAAQIVTDAECGIVCQPGSLEAVTEAVQAMLRLPLSARLAMGAAGRRYASEHFRRAANIAALADLIETAGFELGERNPVAPGYRGKRLLDVGLGAALLVITFPLWPAIAAAIILEDGWPILYQGDRVGRWGNRFKMLKFRSMRNEAGPRLTVSDDRRITRVGAFIRRTKLDELPQLVNVLAGHMSLVGPRPEDPFLWERFPAESKELLQLAPGLTGLSQLANLEEEHDLGSPDTADYIAYRVPSKLALDRTYLRTSNLKLDLKILVCTGSRILRTILRMGPER